MRSATSTHLHRSSAPVIVIALAGLAPIVLLGACGPRKPRACGGVPAQIVAEAIAEPRAGDIARRLATAIRLDDTSATLAAATEAGEQLGVLARVLTDDSCGRERLPADWLRAALASLQVRAVALVLDQHRERYLAAAPDVVHARTDAPMPSSAQELQRMYLALVEEVYWNARDPALELRAPAGSDLPAGVASPPSTGDAAALLAQIRETAKRAARRSGNL